jgi:hypothetical protein
VVRALQRLALPGAFRQRKATVPADVQEGAQLAVAGVGDDDRRAARAGAEERPRLQRFSRVPDVLPGRAEDQLLLTAQDLGIRVPAIRKRVLD